MKNRLLSISLALIASLALWVYVIMVENPVDSTVVYGIPVVFSGETDIQEDYGLIITQGEDTTIDLSISGKRSVLQQVKSNNVTITIDVSRLKNVGDYNMTYEIAWPDDVSDSDINIVERSPSHVDFTVEKQVSKVIEIKGILDGDVEEGYIAEPMSFDYEEITIYGPEAAVNAVSYGQVILSRTNLNKSVTTSLPFTLIGHSGNAVDTSEIVCDIFEIEVIQPVSKLKELPLVVEFIDGGGATSENVTREITPSTITVSGDAEIVDGINQIILDNIDLSEITGNTTLEYVIPIPNDVKNISGIEKATVDLKIHGLETATIMTTSVDFINVPEGLAATSMTNMVQVTVRAPMGVTSEIATNNVRLVADLATLTTEGTFVVPVTVYVDGFSGVGILGEYTVVVFLQTDTGEEIEGS